MKNYSLKKLSTISLGGKCKEYVCPKDIDELQNFLKTNKRCLFIGNGSNICFITNYYNGMILSLKRLNKHLHHDEKYIYTSCNVSCTKLARYAHNNQIPGFEFLYGIPGTIGGAIFMNAGAFEKEILDCIKSLTLVDRYGKIREILKKDLRYGYRSSKLDKTDLVISAIFKKPKSKFDSFLLNKLNAVRKRNQPTNQLSCGCIFKNPKGYYASKLIQDAKLQGKKFGGIYISNKHANYFINDGSGSYNDFLKLLNYVKKSISDKYGIQLEEEVVLIK